MQHTRETARRNVFQAIQRVKLQGITSGVFQIYNIRPGPALLMKFLVHLKHLDYQPFLKVLDKQDL
jgi:hypothetical protein